MLDLACDEREEKFKAIKNTCTANQILERLKSGQTCLSQFWRMIIYSVLGNEVNPGLRSLEELLHKHQ